MAEPAPNWPIGSWSGTRTDGKSGDRFPITITVRAILAGNAATEEMEVVHGGKTYRAFSTTAFEAETQRWIMLYVNEVDGRFVPMEGVIDGDSSVWRSISASRAREAKLAYDRAGTGVWRRTQFASDDGGTTWFVIFADELSKNE